MPERFATFSPDGRHVAFVRDGDLYPSIWDPASSAGSRIGAKTASCSTALRTGCTRRSSTSTGPSGGRRPATVFCSPSSIPRRSRHSRSPTSSSTSPPWSGSGIQRREIPTRRYDSGSWSSPAVRSGGFPPGSATGTWRGRDGSLADARCGSRCSTATRHGSSCAPRSLVRARLGSCWPTRRRTGSTSVMTSRSSARTALSGRRSETAGGTCTCMTSPVV